MPCTGGVNEVSDDWYRASAKSHWEVSEAERKRSPDTFGAGSLLPLPNKKGLE